MANTCTFSQKMRELYRKGCEVLFFDSSSKEAYKGVIEELGTDYLVVNGFIIRFDKIIWIKEAGE